MGSVGRDGLRDRPPRRRRESRLSRWRPASRGPSVARRRIHGNRRCSVAAGGASWRPARFQGGASVAAGGSTAVLGGGPAVPQAGVPRWRAGGSAGGASVDGGRFGGRLLGRTAPTRSRRTSAARHRRRTPPRRPAGWRRSSRRSAMKRDQREAKRGDPDVDVAVVARVEDDQPRPRRRSSFSALRTRVVNAAWKTNGRTPTTRWSSRRLAVVEAEAAEATSTARRPRRRAPPSPQLSTTRSARARRSSR